MTIPFDLTPADIGVITEAFEVIAGSATGDLGVYAPAVMARDPKWNAAARDLLERIDAAEARTRGSDSLDWSTSSLRDMIARAAQAPAA